MVSPTPLDHAGFRAWVKADDFPESIRATFVAGEVIIDMSPESIENHNKVKVQLTIVLGTIVQNEDLGELYADGALLTNVPASVSTEPDVMFASFATLESGRLRRVHKAHRDDEYIELEGTPDLVVEVVSDSSVKKDLKSLRQAYFDAEIPEYWILDARHEEISFEILSRGTDGYVSRSPSGAPQSSEVLARTFTLTRRKNRIGGWVYELRSHPDVIPLPTS